MTAHRPSRCELTKTSDPASAGPTSWQPLAQQPVRE